MCLPSFPPLKIMSYPLYGLTASPPYIWFIHSYFTPISNNQTICGIEIDFYPIQYS